MENQEPFDGLYEALKKEAWPRVYLYKFIMPADNQKIAKIQNLFNSEVAQIDMRKSKKGNYVSISAKEMMLTPEAVIERYQKAAEIEGVSIL
jgi:putative lipoic acid-binding regulatory protein